MSLHSGCASRMSAPVLCTGALSKRPLHVPAVSKGLPVPGPVCPLHMKVDCVSRGSGMRLRLVLFVLWWAQQQHPSSTLPAWTS